jgi:hypothetical protein
MTQEQAVQQEYDIPDHSNELSNAEDQIEKLRNRLKIIKIQRCIDDKSHDQLFESTVRVLDYVGKLSMSAFALEDQIQDIYFKRYKNSPELAKTLWQEEYGRVHHPYNILKNRCYRLLEELDAEYHKRHKKHPPNWKP